MRCPFFVNSIARFWIGFWIVPVAAAIGCCLPAGTVAATIEITVRDAAGAPVEDAVVSLVRAGGPGSAGAAGTAGTVGTAGTAGTVGATGAKPATTPVMDQRNQQYVPYVLPVRIGTTVKFPNNDNIQHNVYSFSPAKTFELKLFGRSTTPEVVFDKAGIAVLGCNIHDWMLGFVVVLDTPYFGKSARNGSVTLRDLPAGEYTVNVWQPNMQDDDKPVQKVTLGADDNSKASFSVKALKPDRRKPTPSNPFYNSSGGA